MSNGNRNAKELLQMILGSAEVQQSFGTDEKKKAEFLKTFVKNLREKIRTQIDANLPFMYLVDASVIVDSMLRTLDPANKKITGDLMNEDDNTTKKRPQAQSPFAEFTLEPTKTELVYKGIELFKYFISVEGIDKDGQIIKYTNKPNLELGLKEAYIAAYQKLAAKRDIIVTNVLNSITTGIKNTTLEALVEIVSEATKSITDPRKAGSILRSKLNALGVCEIENPGALISGYNPKTQVLIVGQTFDSVIKRVHEQGTKALEAALNETGLVPVTNVERGRKGFKAGVFAAAGHVGITTGEKLIGINTPLLQMATLILALRDPAKKGAGLPSIYNDFVFKTEHKDCLIDIKENYQNFGNQALTLSFAFGRSQEAIYNSKDLGAQETQFINAELQNFLNDSYRNLKRKLEKELEDILSNKNLAVDTLFDKFRMSPTLKENSILVLLNTLDGKKYKGPVGRARATDKPRKTNVLIVPKTVLKKTKLTAKKSNISRPSAVKAYPRTSAINNLSTLMMRINGSLHDQIKTNMGTGNREDVLNYRTGRFANSARVERISESRQGMITAFYSYMKNPYATFSRGGRQERPFSRDPKTLISKSIRELAGPLVANRMRAVLV